MTEPTGTYRHGKYGWVRWVVAVVVVVNVVLLVLDEVLPGPSGEPGSALATVPEGYAAWAELARRNGIEVVITDGPVPDGAIVAADDPDFRNARLAEGDNAARALAFAGDGPLAFVEPRRDARGLAALPDSGKWALGLLGVAAVLYLLARGRRFGPPDPPGREPAPPRVAYVDALAAALAKTRDPAGAMEPITRALDAEAPATEDEALVLARRYAAQSR